MAKRSLNEPPILSSAQAERESRQLKSCWSEESLLSTRTLIYCAYLLEKIAGKKGNRKNRKISKWNNVLSRELKAGKTIQEAAKIYKESKGKIIS